MNEQVYSPEMVPEQIHHIPPPPEFFTRDMSYYEPDWDGIPELAAAFPDEKTRTELSMLVDPCKWAAHEIKVIDPESKKIVPFAARWYQQELLQDNARYQVWRLGRQVGKTTMLMIKALHHAFTHENSKTLILTPYDEQVKKIFWDRPGINFMIEESSTLMAARVGRLTKSPPYRVRFNNGSTITGMTSGTKSGASGGASRGKDADFIILDEADYLDDNDLRTIMGIRIGNPNIRMVASSTPCGKRGLWYDWNHNSRWNVHHYASAVVPHWDNIMDYDQYGNPITFGQEILAGFDEYGIITEVLAEFPEELMGVFQKYYLDIMFGVPEALASANISKNYSAYKYPARPNYRTNKRVMGVDVDKYAAGPEIAIIEWNDQLNAAFILHRQTLQRGRKGELTLTKLADTIWELDQQFKCGFIYVDRGYGEMVIETLHKRGHDAGDRAFVDKVKPVFYGDSIEVPDPVKRGVFTKMPIKPYIVNMMSRFTERMAVFASMYDIKLKVQMENYHVVARSAISGQPRYTSKNEHALDAVMFAMFGLVANFMDELIFPRGAIGSVVRRYNASPSRPSYIDPWTDARMPKMDPRMRPDVMQIHDLPDGARRSLARTASRNRRSYSTAPPRTAWGGYRNTRSR